MSFLTPDSSDSADSPIFISNSRTPGLEWFFISPSADHVGVSVTTYPFRQIRMDDPFIEPSHNISYNVIDLVIGLDQLRLTMRNQNGPTSQELVFLLTNDTPPLVCGPYKRLLRGVINEILSEFVIPENPIFRNEMLSELVGSAIHITNTLWGKPETSALQKVHVRNVRKLFYAKVSPINPNTIQLCCFPEVLTQEQMRAAAASPTINVCQLPTRILRRASTYITDSGAEVTASSLKNSRTLRNAFTEYLFAVDTDVHTAPPRRISGLPMHAISDSQITRNMYGEYRQAHARTTDFPSPHFITELAAGIQASTNAPSGTLEGIITGNTESRFRGALLLLLKEELRIETSLSNTSDGLNVTIELFLGEDMICGSQDTIELNND